MTRVPFMLTAITEVGVAKRAMIDPENTTHHGGTRWSIRIRIGDNTSVLQEMRERMPKTRPQTTSATRTRMAILLIQPLLFLRLWLYIPPSQRRHVRTLRGSGDRHIALDEIIGDE